MPSGLATPCPTLKLITLIMISSCKTMELDRRDLPRTAAIQGSTSFVTMRGRSNAPCILTPTSTGHCPVGTRNAIRTQSQDHVGRFEVRHGRMPVPSGSCRHEGSGVGQNFVPAGLSHVLDGKSGQQTKLPPTDGNVASTGPVQYRHQGTRGGASQTTQRGVIGVIGTIMLRQGTPRDMSFQRQKAYCSTYSTPNFNSTAGRVHSHLAPGHVHSHLADGHFYLPFPS